MRRVFWPVGQGAFYSEMFTHSEYGRDVAIVYDCGSLSGMDYISDAINKMSCDDNEIAALFISHLDRDHINGLSLLFEKFRIRRIYFPMLTRGDKILLSVANRLKHHEDYDFISAFIDNPRECVTRLVKNREEMPELVTVLADTQEDVLAYDRDWGAEFNQNAYNSDDGINFFDPRNSVNGIDIFDDNHGAGDFYWRYIPHNFRQSKRINILIRELQARRIGIKELETFSPSAKKFALIKEAYKVVPGSLNTNSMTLYSGPDDKNGRSCVASVYRPCGTCRAKYLEYKAGCLYTGDYDALGDDKWNSLANAYRNHWDDIGCVQIPHHGSKYNFNDKFLQMCALNVMSVGLGNKHHHPSVDVLAKYQEYEFPFIVTQEPRSLLCMHVF